MNWLHLIRGTIFLYSQESDKRQNFQHFRSTMNSLEWLFSFHVFLTCNGKVLAEIFVSFVYLLGAIASAFKLWLFARSEHAMMRTLSFHHCGMDLILSLSNESQICESSTLLWKFFLLILCFRWTHESHVLEVQIETIKSTLVDHPPSYECYCLINANNIIASIICTSTPNTDIWFVQPSTTFHLIDSLPIHGLLYCRSLQSDNDISDDVNNSYNPSNIFAWHDWSKGITWANIPQLKLENIRGYSPIFKTDG